MLSFPLIFALVAVTFGGVLPGNGKAFNPIDAIGPLFAVPAEGVSMAGEAWNQIEARKAALLGGLMGGGEGLGGFPGAGGNLTNELPIGGLGGSGRKRRGILPGNGGGFNPIDAIGPIFAVPAEGVDIVGRAAENVLP